MPRKATNYWLNSSNSFNSLTPSFMQAPNSRAKQSFHAFDFPRKMGNPKNRITKEP